MSGRRLSGGKKRSLSSRRWLERQLADPCGGAPARLPVACRLQASGIDDRFRLLRAGARVVDLGAAPGGWTQAAVQRTRAGEPGGGRVVAVDLLEMPPVAGAIQLQVDFLEEVAPGLISDALGGPADIVLSDMSPSSSGHADVDHLRIVALVEAAVEFAIAVLVPGGALVAKVRQGGTEHRCWRR